MAIVTNVGAGCGGRDGVGRTRRSQGELRLVSDRSARRRTMLFADGKTVWAWHPLLVSSWRRFAKPNRVSINLQSVSDGDKTNSSPGRARYKPLKPLRREGRIASAEPVCSCAFCYCIFAHETAGAARTRSSPRPLLRVAPVSLLGSPASLLGSPAPSLRGSPAPSLVEMASIENLGPAGRENASPCLWPPPNRLA